MSSTTRDIDQLSEIKELPEGWRWVRLGEVCLPDRQIVEPNTFHAESLTYYSLEHIESETGRILKTPTEPVELEGKSMTFLFDQRHVLYGKLRPYLNKVALPFSSGRCTTEMIPLLPSDGLDRIFLAWLLRRQETVEFAMQGKTGSRMPRADMDSLLMLHIPLPPLPEQQRIAAILKEQMGAVEKARMAAQERLRAIKALPAAFLRQIFPDPGQPLPDGWRWAKLGDVCAIVSKGTTPSSLGFSYVNEGIPFLRAEDINGSVVDPSKVAFYISVETNNALDRSRLLPGDFLITIAGTLGRVGYIAEGMPTMNCNQAVAFARPKRELVDVEYMVCVCQNNTVIAPLLSQKAGGALQNLNLQQVRGLEIPLPPLPEQQRIATIIKEQLAAIEQAHISAEAELKAINTLPAALLRRAFNGEL